MRLITVAGPPSVGKTSVVVKTARILAGSERRVGIVKFDSLNTSDDEVYQRAGLPVKVGLAGSVCPDHFFVSNIDDCVSWGRRAALDFLIAESAGLCNRCSPHIQGVLAVCVIDNLSGVHTPRKIGPMLKLADVVVITKGDIVSQAEREVFSFNVRQANPRAVILFFNGITGQGAAELGYHLDQAPAIHELEGSRLRFPMPSAVCPYCIGETIIGQDHQRGNVRKMALGDKPA
ncbi:GTP-binding protein [Candidatus Methylospira mobilis]|uniref:GTP-binding protein n=1 Tax=Candidatus Methylospira mobilis TaxID=1808979 RepID=UPI0028EC174E|nr:GTP-binding protein [Candidatus Methylospira mobilis]WNV05236.1 GTP-binding protein [Candidatus Methylospira mobilis]